MSEMVGKISVQEKIAELESRIAKLEREKERRGTFAEFRARTKVESFNDSLWLKIWYRFDRLMDAVSDYSRRGMRA